MAMQRDTLAYYRRLSDGYDEKIRQLVPKYDEMTTLMVDRIVQRSPRAVLDVGCGIGTLSEQVLDRLPAATVTAVDASPDMIYRARARLGRFGPRARTVEGDIATSRLEPGFDVVVSSLVLHNLPMSPKQTALRSLVRVLAPRGTFIWADLVRHTDSTQHTESVEYRRNFALRAGCDPDLVDVNFRKEATTDSPLTVEEMARAMVEAGLTTHRVVWTHDTFAVLEFERGPT
jgi:ubiquinone/menaquinone biosynthesis C-methylase UbiE